MGHHVHVQCRQQKDWPLDQAGSEAEYVKAVSRNLARRLIIDAQVLNINTPKVLLDAETKVNNKRRTFKYINIKPSEMKKL